MRRFIFRIALFTISVLAFSSVAGAQSRLVPTGRIATPYPEDALNDYAVKKDSLLLPDYGKTSFAFTVNPSWGGESSCCYYGSTSEFVLRVAEESIWFYYLGAHSQYKQDTTPDVKVNEYRCVISPKTAKSLYDLFYAAVFSSSYTARVNGLDGVTYELLFDMGLFTAEFWSPKQGTNCHKLEEILEKLCDAVKNNNSAAVDALGPDAIELTAAFKELFPKDIENHWKPSF